MRADAAPIPEVLPADDQQRHSRQQPGDGHQAGRLPASGTLGAPGIRSRWSWNWYPLCVHVRHAAVSRLEQRLTGLLCISILGCRLCHTLVRVLPGGCHWRAPDLHLYVSVREPRSGGLQSHDAQLPSCTVRMAACSGICFNAICCQIAQHSANVQQRGFPSLALQRAAYTSST